MGLGSCSGYCGGLLGALRVFAWLENVGLLGPVENSCKKLW